jgi:hypothetical protein
MAEVSRRDGLISRDQALAVAPSHVLEKAVRAGLVTRVFARTYAVPELVADRDLRRRAAVLSVPGAVLSHTDALAVLRAAPGRPASGPVHVSVPDDGRHPRNQEGLVVHRRPGPTLAAAVLLRGVGPTTPLPQALVDSWPLLGPDSRRAAVIDAVRDRRVRTTDVARALDRRPSSPRAAELRHLLGLLDAGCHSELEIWGLAHVFDSPDLPASVPQFAVRLADRTVVLDRAYVRERVRRGARRCGVPLPARATGAGHAPRRGVGSARLARAPVQLAAAAPRPLRRTTAASRGARVAAPGVIWL